MKNNKKALYESIMAIVAKEIKKALNEEKLTASSYSMNSGTDKENKAWGKVAELENKREDLVSLREKLQDLIADSNNKNRQELLNKEKELGKTIVDLIAKIKEARQQAIAVSKSIKESKVFEDYDNIDDVNIQSDTERWCDIIDEYLWDHTYSSADVSEVLGLFATLVYLDQLDDEEIKEIAECIMEQINEEEDYDNPPVDEAFHAAVIEKLKEDASDWCADVINEWKLNQ